MSANLELPHLLVLSADKANRQILNGFRDHHSVNTRQLPLDPVAGGWRKVLEQFQDTHVALMRRYPERRVLIVLDFDEQQDRLEYARSFIPDDLRDRVFVLGCADTPEKLTASLGRKKERVGEMLAEDCDHGTSDTWGHDMLAHNAPELERLRAKVRPFLFKAA